MVIVSIRYNKANHGDRRMLAAQCFIKDRE
mgnify:CR=1 FL=1